MTCDLLVIGGGIAGASAAARAAEAGANVVVVEKDDRLGGSGALSAGILWTAPDRETLRRVCPRGDPELGGVLVDEYDAVVERVRGAGVDVSERWHGQMGFGVAHRIDIAGMARGRAGAHRAGRADRVRPCRQGADRRGRGGARRPGERRRG